MSGLQQAASLGGDALVIMTPLLFAALGGLLTELGGMLNIALEGLITVGAFSSAVVAASTHSVGLAILAGGLGSALLAWFYASASRRLRVNEFIGGLATNLLAAGLTTAFSARIFGTKGVVVLGLGPAPKLEPAALHSLPIVGEFLFRHDILAWASWLAVPLVWFMVSKSTFGLRLRAAGANPLALKVFGRKAENYRLAAVILSGLACGLAGASLTVDLSAYVPNVSSGRGWIALVAVYLGGRKPLGILAACFVFALAESLANWAQGFLHVPSDFILALPYALTLLGLVAGAAWKKLRPR